MANVVEFTIKAQDEFSNSLDKLNAGLTKTQTAFAAAGIAATIFGAVALAKKSLENAEAMGTAALKANLTTEAYSGLAFAASQSNLEVGAMATGLRFLNKAIVEGESQPAGAALAKIGIAARDANGSLRPTVDVLYDIADAFEKSGDDANKTKVAMDIFGKAGKDMVPFLNQGSVAIKQMQSDAQKLGLIISGDFAKSADQINDNFAVMAEVVGGSVNVAMAELAPTIELVTGEIVAFLKEGDSVSDVGAAIGATFKVLFSAGTVVSAMFRQLGLIIGATFAAIVQGVHGDFAGASATMKNLNADLAADGQKTGEKLKGYWDGTAQAAAAAANVSASNAIKLKKSMDVVTQADIDARKEKEKLIKSIKDMEDSLNAQIKTVGMTSDQTKIYEMSLKSADKTLFNNLYSLAAAKEKQEDLKAALDGTKSAIEGQRTELEVHNATMADWQARLDHGKITQEQFTEATKRQTEAWDKAKVSTDGYKQGVTNAFKEANTQIAAHLKSLGSVSYQIGSMIAKVFDTVVAGIGDAMADAIVNGKNLSDSMTSLYNSVLKTVISTLIQIGIQRAVLSALIVSGYATEATAATTSAGVMVAGGTAVSIAWGPIAAIALAVVAAVYILKEAVERFGPIGVAVGLAMSAAWLPIATIALAIVAAIWLIKEAIEMLKKVFSGNVPAMVVVFSPLLATLGVVKDIIEAIIGTVNKLLDTLGKVGGAVGAVGGAVGGIVGGASDAVGNAVGSVSDVLSFSGGGYTGSGARAGGVDGEGGFYAVLHPNETVIDHSINKGSTSGTAPSDGGSAGGTIIIQNLTVHVMENATNVDAYSRMDKVQLRATLGQPVVDALNSMFELGVRPNFATQVR